MNKNIQNNKNINLHKKIKKPIKDKGKYIRFKVLCASTIKYFEFNKNLSSKIRTC